MEKTPLIIIHYKKYQLKSIKLLLCCLLILLLLPACRSIDQGTSVSEGVPAGRLSRLNRGINLSHWFMQTTPDPVRFRNYITSNDLKKIRRAGFVHVRLPINPEILLEEENPEELNSENLCFIDNALDLILGNDLAVIVDIHPSKDFKRHLANEPELVQTLAGFWRSLARHLRSYNPELVFLEVLNEPGIKEPGEWEAIQKKLLAEMREGAPNHTLIATGYKWGSIDNLLTLTPLADSNIVYNFHFYDSLIFTHQGADWGMQWWPLLRSIPYPSTPEKVEAVLFQMDDDGARARARLYGEERWNKEKIESILKAAAEWAQKNKVRVSCNEFGVSRAAAPPNDRSAWIRDVRTLLEKYRIGWTMWDYAGGFDAVIEEDGRRKFDPKILEALGLSD